MARVTNVSVLLSVLLFALSSLISIISAQRRPPPPKYDVFLPETRRNFTLIRTTKQPSVTTNSSGLYSGNKPTSLQGVGSSATPPYISTKATARRTKPTYGTDSSKRGGGDSKTDFPDEEYFPSHSVDDNQKRKESKKKNKTKSKTTNKPKGRRHDIIYWPTD